MVVFSPALQDKGLQKLPTGFEFQLCVPLDDDSEQDLLNQPVSDVDESPDTAGEEEERVYPSKT